MSDQVLEATRQLVLAHMKYKKWLSVPEAIYRQFYPLDLCGAMCGRPPSRRQGWKKPRGKRAKKFLEELRRWHEAVLLTVKKSANPRLFRDESGFSRYRVYRKEARDLIWGALDEIRPTRTEREGFIEGLVTK